MISHSIKANYLAICAAEVEMQGNTDCLKLYSDTCVQLKLL